MKRFHRPLLAVFLTMSVPAWAMDQNGNSQSDVWEMLYGATSLPAGGDPDHDGWTNAQESAAGTDPFNPASFPRLDVTRTATGIELSWLGRAGKRYTLQTSADLAAWTVLATGVEGQGSTLSRTAAVPPGAGFYRVVSDDIDSDGDGISDWEEMVVGYDPHSNRTEREDELDAVRLPSELSAGNTIVVSTYADTCSERWPSPAILVVRRSGGLHPLSVHVALSGTATLGTDYTVTGTESANTAVRLGLGQREAFVAIKAIADSNDAEPNETVILTVQGGTGYTVAGQNSATVTILNQTATSGPSPQEAARFLIQAAFGPDQDSPADSDQIPENVEEVMAIGIGPWIDAQLGRPVGKLLPMMEWQEAQPESAHIYNDRKMNAWWGRAMGLPKLRPDAATTQLPDPLRQRVAFALSQIFVISDRMERLATEPKGMAHFYDTLLQDSFGNYRTLLKDVTLHPCMGIYLSDLGNRKADPVAHTFPDENYAREVMQLFSIGLWMLNPDGSRKLDGQGQPIPTYTNANITEFARVFTGLSYGELTTSEPIQFGSYNGDFTKPMKGWDEEHDLGAKTLLLGATTPARTASSGNQGTATMADVDALIDNLFNHPNVGPFIGRQLIQRLVTSNPSPAYIARVSAAFDATPRGDMGRTIKAILMGPEARDAAKMSDPTFGKLREPFLKVVNVARAFNASSAEGWYYLDAFDIDHVEEPFNAPSVFNFYLPAYSPPGALSQAGLVAPEMQIVNASSAVSAPNYYWDHLLDGLHRWGAESPARNVNLNIDQEMLLNVPPGAIDDPGSDLQPLDPDPLIRRLDLALTGGTLTPQSFQIIREALARIGPGSGWDWPRSRLKLAIYLIVCSPEFSVQH